MRAGDKQAREHYCVIGSVVINKKDGLCDPRSVIIIRDHVQFTEKKIERRFRMTLIHTYQL